MRHHPYVSCQSIKEENKALIILCGRASDQTGRLDPAAPDPSRRGLAEQRADLQGISVHSRGPLSRSEGQSAGAHRRQRYALIVENDGLAVRQIIVKILK